MKMCALLPWALAAVLCGVAWAQEALTLTSVPVTSVEFLPSMVFPAPASLITDQSQGIAERAADPQRIYVVQADTLAVMAWAATSATQAGLRMEAGLPDGYPEVPPGAVVQWWRSGAESGYTFVFADAPGASTYFAVQRIPEWVEWLTARTQSR